MQASRGCCPSLTAAAGFRAGAAGSGALAAAGGVALSRERAARSFLACPRKDPKKGTRARPGTLLRAPRAGGAELAKLRFAQTSGPLFPARGTLRKGLATGGGVNRRRSGHWCPGPDPLRCGAPESCVSWLLMQRRPGAPTGSSFVRALRRAHSQPSLQRNRVRAGAGPPPSPDGRRSCGSAGHAHGPTRAPSRYRVCNGDCGRCLLRPSAPTDPF